VIISSRLNTTTINIRVESPLAINDLVSQSRPGIQDIAIEIPQRSASVTSEEDMIFHHLIDAERFEPSILRTCSVIDCT
jgi:hypothetical protein